MKKLPDSGGLLDILGCVVQVCQEQIKNHGEDSYAYSLNEESAMVSVFDGCGGAGTRSYPEFGQKTGAYLASRACATAAFQWFDEFSSGNIPEPEETRALKHGFLNAVRWYASHVHNSEGDRISGSISKLFPTTAVAIALHRQNGVLNADYFWAGDSRGYWLDRGGLAQVTRDDLNIQDAFENLTADGVLQNVVSASKDFTLHAHSIKLDNAPGLLFAATDGCFGYFSTPMEFEYLLLDTLVCSKSVEEWQNKLKENLAEFAGDDFTLCGLPLRFTDFQDMQRYFAERRNYLYEQYISKLDDLPTQEDRRALWEQYRKKEQYYRLCAGNTQM